MENNDEVTRNSTKITPEIRSHEHGFVRAPEQKTYGAVRWRCRREREKFRHLSEELQNPAKMA